MFVLNILHIVFVFFAAVAALYLMNTESYNNRRLTPEASLLLLNGLAMFIALANFMQECQVGIPKDEKKEVDKDKCFKSKFAFFGQIALLVVIFILLFALTSVEKTQQNVLVGVQFLWVLILALFFFAF